MSRTRTRTTTRTKRPFVERSGDPAQTEKLRVGLAGRQHGRIPLAKTEVGHCERSCFWCLLVAGKKLGKVAPTVRLQHRHDKPAAVLLNAVQDTPAPHPEAQKG